MTNPLNLRAGVGPGEDNRDDDVDKVRKSLSEIGHKQGRCAPHSAFAGLRSAPGATVP